MFDITFSPNWFMISMGIVVSVFFSYFPKVNLKWAAMDETPKRLIMLGIGVGCLGLVAIGGCTGVLTSPSCDKAGAAQMLTALWWWVVANQSVYKATPLTAKYRAVREQAKAARLYQMGIGL